MKLVLPSIEYKKSFLEALEEWREVEQKMEIEESLVQTYDSSADFAEFVERLRGRAEGKSLPEGYVPNTYYWLVDKERFIGWLDIRHSLNDSLLKTGGHIGYTIRPRERKKGYGKEILRLGLEKAKELGITNALLTCNSDNHASINIIEKNGGVFENTATTDQGVIKRRYWITIP